jgi:hypothetical protein
MPRRALGFVLHSVKVVERHGALGLALLSCCNTK